MRYRKLGASGPEISVVGVGSWAMGGPYTGGGWGPQDDDDSLAALRHAVDLGVTWVDTAAVYGHGHAEEVVGRLLQDRPETLVFTKCGLNWWENENGELVNDLRPQSIRFELEQSLKRLGTDHVDLYQFHWPDTIATPVEDSWATMAELVDEGKVRWAGVSNFDVDLLERCQRVRHVDSLQPPFSLIDRRAAGDLLPWCAANGTGVICYSPMQSGLLTGTFDRSRLANLPADDWRRTSPEFEEPALSRNLALAGRLEPVAERHGVTVAAVAVAWVTAQAGVTGAIVGARRPSQVDGWIAAGDLELTEADLAELEAAIRETGAG
jgi:aryl-alcohol dehydrogenase-like predicted oxidoreductase